MLTPFSLNMSHDIFTNTGILIFHQPANFTAVSISVDHAMVSLLIEELTKLKDKMEGKDGRS